MSVYSVLTGGFGSFSNVNKVATLGFTPVTLGVAKTFLGATAITTAYVGSSEVSLIYLGGDIVFKK